MKMKIKLFCIHDVKAEAYLPPFHLNNEAMAIRTFADTVNDSKHPFSLHPEDYTLFELGSYEDDNGKITLHQTKIPLGNGLDYKKPDPQMGLEFPEDYKHMESV